MEKETESKTSSEKTTNLPGKKAGKKKMAKDKGDTQVATPSGIRPTTSIIGSESERTVGDLPERFAGLEVESRYGVGSTPVGPPVKPTPRPQPSKKQGPKSGGSDIAEFILEEEEIKSKKHRGKGSAEDGLAELEKILGISLVNAPSHLCLRPNFESGRAGDRVTLLSNFFRLKLTGSEVYQYDIAFLKPDESAAAKKEQEIGRKFKRITKRLNQSLLTQFVKTTGAEIFRERSYAYDNERILITNKPLNGISGDGQVFRFTMTEARAEGPLVQTYLIRIKPTVRLSLAFESIIGSKQHVYNNRAVLQVIDIICKTHAFQNDIVYGTKIFSASNQTRQSMDTRNGPTPFELAFGYHQSTQLCQGGAMLNIDRATAVLYKPGPLVDAMCQLLKVNSPADIRMNPFNHQVLEELTYIRVETTYRGYPSCHTIKTFTQKPSRDIYLTDDNARRSVADYFRTKYAINLRYSDLPCIIYGTNKNYIPVELCTILPNQRNQRKLRDELIRIVSQHATSQKPSDRSAHTANIARSVSEQLSSNDFDIQLIPTQVTVESRVIMSPKLNYSNEPNFWPRLGDWDMREHKFLRPVELKNWALFTLESRKMDSQVAGRFVDCLKRTGNTLGMRINNPSNPYILVQSNNLTKLFKDCASKNLQLIVIMMPESIEYYGLVKYLGDQCLKIPTQVVLDKHYDSRGQRQKLFDAAYLNNLLLKINTKIGGVNLKLSDSTKCPILTKKTMVVGIDVNHPSPGENSRSIAAVVGSIDAEFMEYRTEIQANRDRDELVRVDEMIKPIIQKFKERQKDWPNHIIVYRDGVSEGQFAHVMGHEILPLHKKLETIPKPPKLTYIIVQKRHNARFYPMDERKATRKGNMLPGTVIDTDVVHYKWFDFYLCSQNSFLGTARPGKYTVLWNSSSAKADDLQMATYHLCYLFSRATKSIADPAPARYAHHAATRGKIHYRELSKIRDWSDEEINTEISRAINVDEKLRNVLYFI